MSDILWIGIQQNDAGEILKTFVFSDRVKAFEWAGTVTGFGMKVTVSGVLLDDC